MDALTVVLVRSIYPNNIGATSRAMVNMGFTRLVLIAPQCEVGFEARQGAAAGQDPLRNRIEYASWSEFFAHEGAGLRIGLTRRAGRSRPLEALSQTLTTHNPAQPLYLFFGPEDDGLNNDELLSMNHCCELPTYSPMGSLNLAQAVLLALFIVRQTTRPMSESIPTPAPAPFPDHTLREWLEVLGFKLQGRKVNAFTTLKRMLLKNGPTAVELRVLESVLRQTIRKLRSHHGE